jgi:hypothetical protein
MLFTAGVVSVSRSSSRSNSGSSGGSDHGKHEKQAKATPLRNFKFSSEKLSATAETFVDIIQTEVTVEQEEDEEEGGPKLLSKHDYKVNKLTWYSHNCLPVALQGSTLQVSGDVAPPSSRAG